MDRHAAIALLPTTGVVEVPSVGLPRVDDQRTPFVLFNCVTDQAIRVQPRTHSANVNSCDYSIKNATAQVGNKLRPQCCYKFLIATREMWNLVLVPNIRRVRQLSAHLSYLFIDDDIYVQSTRCA